MSNNTDTNITTLRTLHFTQRDYAWMIGIFVFTPLTAMALSILGYISTTPLIAAIDGLLVSFMYVGFRLVNAWRRLRLHSKLIAQSSGEEPVSE